LKGTDPDPEKMTLKSQRYGWWRRSGITLVEVVVAMAIGGLIMTAVTTGFIQCMRQAEWTSHCLAANSLAVQRLEQARAATWDRGASIDQVVSANFPADVEVLDIPISKTNIIYATNYTTILTISSNPPLKMIRVDCVWGFLNRGLFTNTIATYRAPDT
jgi:prepilin-type N-terminal cleavage/methylation domain-containing protein